jgi:SAM-dependent methyltransferase
LVLHEDFHMAAKKTDKNWEFYGRTDPYYGVLTVQEYSRENLDIDALNKFFELGQQHIERVFGIVRANFSPSFRPKRALDFGCGVGRLVIPLAATCETVVGVDVSTSMLNEAQANCAQRGIANVDFVQSDDDLSRLTGQFDFIHSYIVFQHIPCARGERILQRLLNLLEEDGVGALHFTYLRRFHTNDVAGRFIDWARRSVGVFNGIVNLIRKRPFFYPRMEMNEYDLGRLLNVLQANGCHNLIVRYSKHTSLYTTAYGVILFFQKRHLDYW